MVQVMLLACTLILQPVVWALRRLPVALISGCFYHLLRQTFWPSDLRGQVWHWCHVPGLPSILDWRLHVRMQPCVCVFQDCSVGHRLRCVFVNSGFLLTPKTDAVGPSCIFFKGVFEHKVSVRGLHVVACVLFMLDVFWLLPGNLGTGPLLLTKWWIFIEWLHTGTHLDDERLYE